MVVCLTVGPNTKAEVRTLPERIYSVVSVNVDSDLNPVRGDES